MLLFFFVIERWLASKMLIENIAGRKRSGVEDLGLTLGQEMIELIAEIICNRSFIEFHYSGFHFVERRIVKECDLVAELALEQNLAATPFLMRACTSRTVMSDITSFSRADAQCSLSA